jgi:hypothetical protein
MFLDFTLDPGATVNQKVPRGWNGFVYVLQVRMSLRVCVCQ